VASRPRRAAPGAVFAVAPGMHDTIEFLSERAEELRELAPAAPEIAADLRHLADALDAAAEALRREPRRQ
jgi:prefoldin subunit 5